MSRPRRLLLWLLLALSSSAPHRAAADHLADLQKSGELRWGNDSQGGAPYVFQDPMDPNHLIGFEVELADAIAKDLQTRSKRATRAAGSSTA